MERSKENFKICEGCGITIERRKGEQWRDFNQKRYHTRACAQQNGGNKLIAETKRKLKENKTKIKKIEFEDEIIQKARNGESRKKLMEEYKLTPAIINRVLKGINPANRTIKVSISGILVHYENFINNKIYVGNWKEGIESKL